MKIVSLLLFLSSPLHTLPQTHTFMQCPQGNLEKVQPAHSFTFDYLDSTKSTVDQSQYQHNTVSNFIHMV